MSFFPSYWPLATRHLNLGEMHELSGTGAQVAAADI